MLLLQLHMCPYLSDGLLHLVVQLFDLLLQLLHVIEHLDSLLLDTCHLLFQLLLRPLPMTPQDQNQTVDFNSRILTTVVKITIQEYGTMIMCTSLEEKVSDSIPKENIWPEALLPQMEFSGAPLLVCSDTRPAVHTCQFAP